MLHVTADRVGADGTGAGHTGQPSHVVELGLDQARRARRHGGGLLAPGAGQPHGTDPGPASPGGVQDVRYVVQQGTGLRRRRGEAPRQPGLFEGGGPQPASRHGEILDGGGEGPQVRCAGIEPEAGSERLSLGAGQPPADVVNVGRGPARRRGARGDIDALLLHVGGALRQGGRRST